MLVRSLTVDDIEPLIQLGHVMHKESVYHNLDFSEEKLRTLGMTILSSPTEWCCLVAEDSDKNRVGMLVGFITQHVFGTDRIAQDFITFIFPNKRGMLGGRRLIQEIERWAAANGAKSVHLGITTGVTVDRTSQLYERLGYTNGGVLYTKRV